MQSLTRVLSMVTLATVFFIHLFSYVSASGVIELRIVSYKNEQNRDDQGQCCGKDSAQSCSSPCSTFFRICLKQYQNVITAEPNCTYGSRVTDLLSSKDGQTKVLENSMKFPFPFSWMGDLTVIVEAWHTSSGVIPSSSNSTNVATGAAELKQLLLRVAERKSLTVGQQWTDETYKNEYSVIEMQYRVMCDEHYFGADCASYCKPRDDTFGHFRCNDEGKKICMDGWSGNTCNIAKCLPGCHPTNGLCDRPNECTCRVGYVGKFCDECMRYPGCQHGSCAKPYDCNCEEGWGGLFCNQDLNYCTHHKPCLNSATCTNTGAGHYTCTCRPGYTGTNCETKIETCDLDPCFNGATCRETGTNYTCSCVDGFSGKHCQTFAKTCSEKPCENGASCINLSNGYMCACAPGWEGSNCDIEIDMCQASPCSNGGSCVTKFGGFTCLCPTGFVGETCRVNKNDCSAKSCLNGGTCVDEVDNFKCVCPPGFIGTLCQFNVDDCIKRPCANGGTCFDLINDYKCECRHGFKGKDCSIDINECESNPCRYGATCEDVVGDYICHCGPCYTGKDCRTRNDDCLWDSTFKPYLAIYNYSTSTPVYSRTTTTESNAAGQSAQQLSANLPLMIGLPLVVVFIVIMIILIVIIFCLLRRTKLRSNSNAEDAEANRQNKLNDRRLAQNQNNKDNRLSVAKLDNDLRGGSSAKVKSIEHNVYEIGSSHPTALKNSNLLAINANVEPKVYKVVTVDKITNLSSKLSQKSNNFSPVPSESFDACSSSFDSGACTPDVHDATFSDSPLRHSVDDQLHCDVQSMALREMSTDSGLASPVAEQSSPRRTAGSRTALHQLHRHPPTTNYQASFGGHSRSQV